MEGSGVERESVSRRRVLAGAAALGGAGAAAALMPASALAATSEYFVNSADYVSAESLEKGLDVTTSLQSAINAAIKARKPLYLGPGTYKTSATLKAETDRFQMFGAGPEWSVIRPAASSYHTLEIGNGVPSVNLTGSVRDIGFAGGNAEIAKAGVEPVTGKAALLLNGATHYSVRNVHVAADSAFDIGFMTINNCYGTHFIDVVAGQNGCRVGTFLGNGGSGGSGSDVMFTNAWLCGEVAAVIWGNEGGGYHFVGGQLISSLQATAANDLRGTVMAGYEYPTGTTNKELPAVDSNNFLGVDFETPVRCWCIRVFSETTMSFDSCRFQGNGSGPAIGVFKSSYFQQSRLALRNSRLAGSFSKPSSELLKLESAFPASLVLEEGTTGFCSANGVEFQARVNGLVVAAQFGQGTVVAPQRLAFNGLLLRNEAGELERSTDWGSTWRPVGPASAETLASATAIAPKASSRLVNVTGSAEIKKIAATFEGHEIILKFGSTAKLVNGENLRIGSTFAATEADCIHLICDGTNWYRVAAAAVN